MDEPRSNATAGTIATIVIAIVLLWLLLKLLGVALKLVGLVIIGGLAVMAYLAVAKRLQGPGDA